MFAHVFEWPPSSTTIIGFGMIVGLVAFAGTGIPEVGIAVAAMVKILMPQRHESAIETVEEAVEEIV